MSDIKKSWKFSRKLEVTEKPSVKLKIDQHKLYNQKNRGKKKVKKMNRASISVGQ